MKNQNTTKKQTNAKTQAAPAKYAAIIAAYQNAVLLEKYATAKTLLKDLQKKQAERRKNKREKEIKAFENVLLIFENEIASRKLITAENVKTTGERIAIKALKTVYAKSGHAFILRLYNGLIADINDKTAKTLSNGYDVASVASAFLCNYIGKSLDDTTDEKDKDGNPATVLRSCFRAVNRYIMSERQKVYKCLYVDEINENGERLYYELPVEWDIDGATDYKTITAIIAALKLSVSEKRFLSYRLRGKSLANIAYIMGVAEGTAKKYQTRIREKAKKCENLAPLVARLEN